MNKIIFSVLLGVLLFCNSCQRSMFEKSIDHKNNTVIKGEFTFDDLKKDNTFTWFNSPKNTYLFHEESIDIIKKNNDVEVLVIGGTWCGDTKEHFPYFYALLQHAKYSESKVTLIGVDRQKEDLKGYSKKYQIEKVPTFIFLDKGKEIGRIIENPIVSIEQDWAAIVSKRSAL